MKSKVDTENRTITCYMPFDSGNQYSENIKRYIQEAGYEVLSIRQVLKNPGLFLKCKIINLNWFETIDNKSKPKRKLIYLVKKLFVSAFKFKGSKIIYNVHNIEPHNVNCDDLEIRLIKYLLKKSDAVVGLCTETSTVIDKYYTDANKKLNIIPHPSYEYDSSQNIEHIKKIRREKGIQDGDCVFLMLGYLSPYKNIDILVDTIKGIKNENVKLLLAGKVSDKLYEEKLITVIGESKKIIRDFRYIPDEEISDYYNISDIIILPYEKRSSLNSGAAYLSFSMGKTVICPCIGTIKDVKGEFVYSYDYETAEEHKEKLKNTILKVVEDIDRDKDILISKGRQAKEYMVENHGKGEIIELYKNLYYKLLNKNHR